MRYAIISDVHGNLEALKAFLKLLPGLNVEKLICLGDFVGYNPNPNECIKILAKINSAVFIRGNHDRVCVDKKYQDFLPQAIQAIRWTIDRLSVPSRDFLISLKTGPVIVDGLFGICHGSPLDEDEYILNAYDAKGHFSWLGENRIRLLFFGHTHMQRVYSLKDRKSRVEKVSEVRIEPDRSYLINPGSLGQPRDRNHEPGFALFDSDSMKVRLLRFPYSFEKTGKKIISQGLPGVLAARLAAGY